MSRTELFSVYWKDKLGNQYKEKTLVPVQEAADAMKRLTQGPAAIMGAVKEVLITDTGDCTCFLWKEGSIIFPTKEDIEKTTQT